MSIKVRLALLLGGLALALIAALVALRQIERRDVGEMLLNDRDSRAQLLDHWIDVTGRSLPQFATDAAQSEEFAALLSSAQQPANRQKLSSSLVSSGISGLWIMDASGTPRLGVSATADATPNEPPLAGQEFKAVVAETPNPRFFAEGGRMLWEVCIRKLQTIPGFGAAGWLMVARRWDDAQLRAIAGLTDAAVTLRSPHDIAEAPPRDARVVLLRPLMDWQSHPLRVLRVDYEAPEIQRALNTEWRQALVFLSFGLLVLAAMSLALHAWVVRPLGQISEALATGEASLVQPLAQEKSDLGRVAQLVLTAFEHRHALQREVDERKRTQVALERSEAEVRRTMEERARLGRDLHDGVIQSLYAAGMGLAGIRALLRPEDEEAAARLEQTRTALNETIHDVRNFIIGLEPEALKLQTFSHAVTALIEVMRGIRQFQSTISIDEDLATHLTLAQRVQALQITREAISNALRHGAASAIEVTLRERNGHAEFEVRDNGSGFNANEPRPKGKGLSNFAERARELGAELSVHSQPGEGAQVKLVFTSLLR